jgi:hypothetical protein
MAERNAPIPGREDWAGLTGEKGWTEARPGRKQGRGRLRRPSRADEPVLAGVVALVLAQILPAFRAAEPVPGWVATVYGWIALPFGEPVLFLGWTANLWLIVAVIARVTRHARTALVAAAAAELSALVGLWSLATFDIPLLDVGGLDIGALVWLAAVALVAVGVLQWGVPRLRQGSESAT